MSAARNICPDNFQFETTESFMCTRCHEAARKRQKNISWFVSKPNHRDTEVPTLQDALWLGMQPERLELLCQNCRHDEFCVTTNISQLLNPSAGLLHLNWRRVPEDPSQRGYSDIPLSERVSRIRRYPSSGMEAYKPFVRHTTRLERK